MIIRWLSRFDLFLKTYLVMEMGCVYFLFNYVEGISFTEKAGESVLFRAVWLLLYAILIVQIARDIGVFGLLLLQSFWFVAFLSLAVVSLVYNDIEGTSLLKFAMYLATILFSAWMAMFRSVDDIMETLFRMGAVVLVLHILLYPVIGAAIDYDPLHRATVIGTEAYAGVFGHKNLAGSFFGLMATISFVRMLSGGRTEFLWSGSLMGLHLVALAATGAAGPLVSVTATLVVTLGLYLIASGRRAFASFYWIALGFLAMTLLLVPSDAFYTLVGRTEGLTGRTFLWSVWPHFFWLHPFLGYGFSGFFNGLPNAPSNELTQMAPWNIEFGSFENSYMELLLQFGLLGGGVYLMIIARAVFNVTIFAFRRARAYWLAPFAVLSFILISSLNDSSLLLHNYIACVLVFWCYFGPEAEIQERGYWTLLRLRPSIGYLTVSQRISKRR